MLNFKYITYLTLIILIVPWSISVTNADSGFPLTVEDDFGRTVTIASPPTRIVSTAPSNTEILFALGLGEKVVGVTQYCDWPPIVPEKVQKGEIVVIGGYSNPSLESIVALNPELVLAATDLQAEFVTIIQNRGLVVVALNPKTVDNMIDDIALVGTICGKTSEANRLITNLQSRVNYVSDRIAGSSVRPRVYYELWYDPLMSFGENTIFNELIVKAGGDNIFHDSSAMFPIVSGEMIVQKDPEIIIFSESYMGSISSSDLKSRPGWNIIKAIKEDKVYTIDENLIVRTGPRIVDGLENLASIVHPELFTGTIHYNSSISVTSNSTIFAIIYDDSRSMLNFSLIDRGKIASLKVDIEKKLLKGTPVVLIDGVEKEVTYTENEKSFIIDFTSELSTHQIVVGGSQTVPEFVTPNITGTVFFVLIITFLMGILHKRKTNY